MHQFGVYRNGNAATRARYPLLLNVQSDLIAETGTRVVVPLLPVMEGRPSPAIAGLAPVITVDGAPHVLVVPLLAAVEVSELGAPVTDLSSERSTIVAALDLLISGI